MLATNLRKFKEQAQREGEQLGLQKGREEGERVGLEKGMLTIARNMKADGVSWETIRRYTGLPLEQIEKL